MIYYCKELVSNGRKPVYKIQYMHNRAVVPYIEGENNSDYVVKALNQIDDVINAISLQVVGDNLTQKEKNIKRIINRYRGMYGGYQRTSNNEKENGY